MMNFMKKKHEKYLLFLFCTSRTKQPIKLQITQARYFKYQLKVLVPLILSCVT